MPDVGNGYDSEGCNRLLQRRAPYSEGFNPAAEVLSDSRRDKEMTTLVRCKDCIHNVANRKTDPMDITDYSGQDIVCDYFMTDGQEPDDYCSHAERIESRDDCICHNER